MVSCVGERETDRERQRETDRQRETERDRQKERDTEREGERNKHWPAVVILVISLSKRVGPRQLTMSETHERDVILLSQFTLLFVNLSDSSVVTCTVVILMVLSSNPTLDNDKIVIYKRVKSAFIGLVISPVKKHVILCAYGIYRLYPPQCYLL